MKKELLNCYYSIETKYKVANCRNNDCYGATEKFEHEDLLFARDSAFKRFEEIVHEILDKNMLTYDTKHIAYGKLLKWFLKPIIIINNNHKGRKAPFQAQRQLLSLCFHVDCMASIGEPKKELISCQKFEIFAINPEVSILDILDNLAIELSAYNFLNINTNEQRNPKTIAFDFGLKHTYQMIDTELSVLQDIYL